MNAPSVTWNGKKLKNPCNHLKRRQEVLEMKDGIR